MQCMWMERLSSNARFNPLSLREHPQRGSATSNSALSAEAAADLLNLRGSDWPVTPLTYAAPVTRGWHGRALECNACDNVWEQTAVGRCMRVRLEQWRHTVHVSWNKVSASLWTFCFWLTRSSSNTDAFSGCKNVIFKMTTMLNNNI